MGDLSEILTYMVLCAFCCLGFWFVKNKIIETKGKDMNECVRLYRMSEEGVFESERAALQRLIERADENAIVKHEIEAPLLNVNPEENQPLPPKDVKVTDAVNL